MNVKGPNLAYIYAGLLALLAAGGWVSTVARAETSPQMSVEEPQLNQACQEMVPTITGSRLIVGTEGDDYILGSGKRDRILGLGGNDTICSMNGNDVVKGGEGNDWVAGMGGSDYLYGNEGDDQLHGMDAADFVDGGKHFDECNGHQPLGNDASDSGINCELSSGFP